MHSAPLHTTSYHHTFTPHRTTPHHTTNTPHPHAQVKTGTLRGPVAIPATPVLQMPVAPAVAAPTAVAAASPVLPSISAPQAAAVAPAAAATPVAGGDAVIFRHQSTGRFISVITSKGGTLGWLRCDADDSYSLASRAFQVVPQDGGWVALKSLATQVRTILCHPPLPGIKRLL